MNHQPVSIGMVGLGGFAQTVQRCLTKLAAEADPLLRLAAACEPMQELHAEKIAGLRAAGVTVVSDFAEILKLPVQALWLPVPIQLHKDFSIRAMEAGKWVICEKPAAGAIQDVDEMIAARDRLGARITIGFQDIHERSTPLIKRELLAGVIGRLQRVTTTCCWARGSDYFARNNWAGHARCGNTWVLDSPCMNAMAHFVNLPLFLMGRSMESTATPVGVSAELYRARAIETADTCTIRVRTAEGPEALFLLTHACEEHTSPLMEFIGERGRCTITPAEAVFTLASGEVRRIVRQVDHARSAEVAIGRWTQRRDDEVLATLELARQQVLVVNAAFDAAPVRDLPASAYTVKDRGGVTQPVIHDISATLAACAEAGKLPSELGVSWAQPGGTLGLAGYTAFRGTWFPPHAVA